MSQDGLLKWRDYPLLTLTLDLEKKNIPLPNANTPPGIPPPHPPPQPPELDLFGSGGTSNEPPVGLDTYRLPVTRLQTTDEEIFCCRWAVVDHLSMAQCAGFAGSCFNEVQNVWSSVQVLWAGAFSNTVIAIVITL
jgi:hypothetical protein